MSTSEYIDRFLHAGGEVRGFHEDGSPKLWIGFDLDGTRVSTPTRLYGLSAHEKLAWRAAAARVDSQDGSF